MINFYEFDETTCPRCGYCPTNRQPCTQISCDEGWINLFDEDPLWYDEDDVEICTNCHGTGIEHWCSNCGFDLQTFAKADDEEEIE